MNSPITIRQIKYALAVARHGGFNRAAQNLNISQSSVSEQVRLLEEFLDVEIFDRKGPKVELTVHGRLLLEKAESVLVEADQLVNLALSIHQDNRPSMRIGLGSGVGSHLANQALKDLSERDGGCRVEFSVTTTGRLLRLVSEDRLDLAIAVKTDNHRLPIGVTQTDLAETPMVVVLPEEHYLAQRNKPLSPLELADEPLIMNQLGIGYAALVLHIFQSIALYPKISMVSDNVDLILDLVVARLGLAILPSVCVDVEKQKRPLPGICVRPLESDIVCQFSVFRNEQNKAEHIDNFIQALQQWELFE
ncbi:LysR family transcriptional regulator [Cognatishimia activa]|uniref:Cyn operon transcriptional activator n=1 Tax=Cognatishimia activa TaxID=1715691 RepID=A0A0P1IUV1_9RHOB|nr:LysR family transcriptional regulator [Cognatishimia activa]CUI47257.1 Cyn operon transcriptional activator [Cognatishimia activa]CUK27263.1 Cyn operon transcriptional activator [Cognatishimia activa]